VPHSRCIQSHWRTARTVFDTNSQSSFDSSRSGTNGTAGPGQVVAPLVAGRCAIEHENRTNALERSQAINVLCPERVRLPDVLGSALRLLHLERHRQIPGEQPETDGDAVGMQPITGQMIEGMAVLAFRDCLFRPPSLPIRRGQPLRTSRAEAGDVDPGTPLVGGRATTEREAPELIIPGTTAQPDCPAVLQPTSLLRGAATLAMRIGPLEVWYSQDARSFFSQTVKSTRTRTRPYGRQSVL